MNPHFIVCLNVKELLARSRHHIWSLSDSNEIRTQNHLLRKRTLNHLAKLTRWLSVRLRTKWLWVRIPLMLLKLFSNFRFSFSSFFFLYLYFLSLKVRNLAQWYSFSVEILGLSLCYLPIIYYIRYLDFHFAKILVQQLDFSSVRDFIIWLYFLFFSHHQLICCFHRAILSSHQSSSCTENAKSLA